MVSAPARREQVRLARCRGLSLRRACALIGVARSALCYERRREAIDAPVLEAMKRLAGQYPRFGYRRIHVYLAREGIHMSWERTYRLWKLAGLQVPRKRGRRRAAVARARPRAPGRAGEVWALDFVFDHCANGQALKCLTVIDEGSRECLAIEVAGRLRAKQVIDTLERLVALHGAPRWLSSDNGPEFVSRALLTWLQTHEIGSALSDPGKPWQNGTDESFNGKLRDECLSMEWFRTRAEARVLIEQWRQHYNHERPHSSLGYRSPAEFKAHQSRQHPSTTAIGLN